MVDRNSNQVICAIYSLYVMVCVSGGKKCLFFGKFDVLCFLETPVLRLALLPYYRQTFERSLSKIATMNNINMVSRKFRENMSKGNVNLAIKILSNRTKGFVLLLHKETIDLLKVKHPVGNATSENAKLHGPLPTIENIIFDVINNSPVLETAKITQGGSGS